jgi:hypothetical protein
MKTWIKIVIASLVMGLIFGGCTDRDMAKLQAYGGSGHITCYSGTKLIFEGDSTGKISSEENSDGYSFVDRKTNKLVEMSGNCVIVYTSY